MDRRLQSLLLFRVAFLLDGQADHGLAQFGAFDFRDDVDQKLRGVDFGSGAKFVSCEMRYTP